MRYVENVRTGEVHEETCLRASMIAQRAEYDPAMAHLLPGRWACWVCLPQGLSKVPREPRILEDPYGTPYPKEVQEFVTLLQISRGTAGAGALVAALESVAWYAWREGNEAGLVYRVAASGNPHSAPKGES